MAGKEIAVKKYVVRLSAERREPLGAHPLGQAVGAPVDEGAHPFEGGCFRGAGEGWSDGKIAEALDTSVANVERTRRQLVEEGLEVALMTANSIRTQRRAGFSTAQRKPS